MTRMLGLPFSVKHVYRNSYYNISFDREEHFHSFLLVGLAEALHSEIVNLRSPLSSGCGGDGKTGADHVFDFLGRGAPLFGTLDRVRVNLDYHSQNFDSKH